MASRLLKKAHLLRCARSPRSNVSVSTPPLVDFSRASHLDLFEQPGISCMTYCSNWNRLSGGYPAPNSNIFMRGTEVSLETFRMLINSVGLFQSLFDSQVT